MMRFGSFCILSSPTTITHCLNLFVLPCYALQTSSYAATGDSVQIDIYCRGIAKNSCGICLRHDYVKNVVTICFHFLEMECQFELFKSSARVKKVQVTPAVLVVQTKSVQQDSSVVQKIEIPLLRFLVQASPLSRTEKRSVLMF